MSFSNSILRIVNTSDLLEELARGKPGEWSKSFTDLYGNCERITCALIFTEPFNVRSMLVPYTYTEGVVEGDRQCYISSDQCFIGDNDGIGGVCENPQHLQYKVIEFAKQVKAS